MLIQVLNKISKSLDTAARRIIVVDKKIDKKVSELLSKAENEILYAKDVAKKRKEYLEKMQEDFLKRRGYEKCSKCDKSCDCHQEVETKEEEK